MMHAEKKRMAAVFVGGAVPAKAAPASGGGEGLARIAAAGPTFQVWSRDSHAFCTECEDTRATVLCQDCDEAYCSLCWAALHRRGERAKHETAPLGSEEDLTPPPEAVEGTGWLAGVWPSQKPRSNSVAAAAAAAGSPPSPSKRGGVSENGDGGQGSTPGLNVNGVVSNGSHVGAGPSVQGADGKGWRYPESASAGAAAAANAGPAPPAASSAGAGSSTPKSSGSDGNGEQDAVSRAQTKKVRLNGSASAAESLAAGPAAAQAATTASTLPRIDVDAASPGTHEVADAASTPQSSRSAGGGGDTSGESQAGGGRGIRPAGYEGPLCPSGEFFSKPQTPPSSPLNCGKRPRSTSTPLQNGGDQPCEDDTPSAAATGAAVLGGSGGTHGNGVARNGAIGAEGNGRANVAGGGLGRGSIQGKGSEETAAEAQTAGGKGGGRGGGVRDPNGNAGSQAGLNGQTQAVNGSAAVAAAAASEGGKAAGSPGVDFDDMDAEAPLFSAEAMAAAAGAGGRVDVEMPLVSPGKNGASSGGVGGDGSVGPARIATAAETRSLANLKQRSTNIPLRLDPRERAILGVLEGSLHHIQYTDAVDRILRGGRLHYVLQNLQRFFTSVWGMHKASGVSPPTYASPANRSYGNGNGGAAPGRYGHGIGSSGMTFQSLPLLPPHGGGGGGSSSSGGGGGSSGWSSSVPNGGGGYGGARKGGAGGRSGGGAGYREDSFVHKRTSWKYSLDWACVLRTCCEVGRRHKILNPEKMRSAHGMLVCILMDTEHPQVRAQTGFSCVRPLRTAFGLSAATNLLGLFDDPDLLTASLPVLPWERDQRLKKGGRSAEEMALQAKEKAEARQRLVARHGAGGLASEVTLLVDSVADSIVYREISTRPIRRMLSLLKHHWRPDRMEDQSRRNVSLAINSGEYGARLTHSHRDQFYFVYQSLSLWLEVTDHMLDLWAAGEKDMLDEHNQYRLSNTGQGLQRVQPANRVGKRMQEYQARVHKKTGQPWVGSAVVHLGDDCVPNALTFLDKYSQVPWILNPILQALDYLSDLDNGSDPVVLGYIKERWGTVEYAQRYILRNFFRFGFDGSGGDNNYEAGSCVDGRLTSAWNWCSKLEKKSFVNIFMLSGFSGFDGDFSR